MGGEDRGQLGRRRVGFARVWMCLEQSCEAMRQILQDVHRIHNSEETRKQIGRDGSRPKTTSYIGETLDRM